MAAASADGAGPRIEAVAYAPKRRGPQGGHTGAGRHQGEPGYGNPRRRHGNRVKRRCRGGPAAPLGIRLRVCRDAGQSEQERGCRTGRSYRAGRRARGSVRPGPRLAVMVVSVAAVASPSQGVSYYERDGYYAKDDPKHLNASAWAGKGAAELGLEGPVDPDTFRAVLEGRVPDGSGSRLGRVNRDGSVAHRPGRDLTFSAPQSVSLIGLIGGDGRVVEAHDRAVASTLAWVEPDVAETRLRDPQTGRMVRAGDQKTVAATFRHDTSRNLDPQLHTHAVLANMLKGRDGKWRTMANEALYRRQSPACRARGAHDPREKTRRGQGGTARKLAAAGAGDGVRRRGAGRGGCRKNRLARAGTRIGIRVRGGIAGPPAGNRDSATGRVARRAGGRGSLREQGRRRRRGVGEASAHPGDRMGRRAPGRA
ncbi:MAG: conjugative relaxase [Gammaproteobacteria bacterium]|nr:conjugative relaxase [Gammaproteobacteria bacterium]